MVIIETPILIPDTLYKNDSEAASNTPRLIQTSNIPFYDASFFFKQLRKVKNIFNRYKELAQVPPFSFIDGGKTGDVYRLKLGDKDLALKLMFNSQLDDEDVLSFLELQAAPLPDPNFRAQRLSNPSALNPRQNILKNIAGSVIGHHLLPQYIDATEYILTKNGQIIGFAAPMIEGTPFSLAEELNDGEFPIQEVIAKLEQAGVELDMAPAAKNAIRLPNGSIKLIDIRLKNLQLLDQTLEEVIHKTKT